MDDDMLPGANDLEVAHRLLRLPENAYDPSSLWTAPASAAGVDAHHRACIARDAQTREGSPSPEVMWSGGDASAKVSPGGAIRGGDDVFREHSFQRTALRNERRHVYSAAYLKALRGTEMLELVGYSSITKPRVDGGSVRRVYTVSGLTALRHDRRMAVSDHGGIRAILPRTTAHRVSSDMDVGPPIDLETRRQDGCPFDRQDALECAAASGSEVAPLFKGGGSNVEPIDARRVYSTSLLKSLRHDRKHPLTSHASIAASRPELPILTFAEGSVNTPHTKDVLLTGRDANLTFSDLMLPSSITTALSKAGLHHPSPVQLRAIPVARMGTDVIAQAKSGTGKTVVFTVVALENFLSFACKPVLTALILAPTRELAMQISGVMSALSADMTPRPTVTSLIGGVPEWEDAAKFAAVTPHIIVGTPGRVLALVSRGVIDVSSLQLLVMDEADRLLEVSFGGSVPAICELLPKQKQTLAFSATYTPELRRNLDKVMRNPKHIRLQDCDSTDRDQGTVQSTVTHGHAVYAMHDAVLHGIRQKKCTAVQKLTPVTDLSGKLNILTALLGQIAFSFCMLFTNDRGIGRATVNHLSGNGFSSMYISANVRQTERLSVMDSVRRGKVQVLVSTDLLARGVDFDSCDTVIHMDVPNDPATYLHRVGRAGRFGKHGLSVIVYCGTEEAANINALEGKLGYRMQEMPLSIIDVAAQAIDSNEMEGVGVSRCLPAATPVSSMDKDRIVFVADPGLEVITGQKPADQCTTHGLLSQGSDRSSELGEEITLDRIESAAILQADTVDKAVEVQYEESSWDTFSRQAYKEGYEDGYRGGFRMAQKIRLSLSGARA